MNISDMTPEEVHLINIEILQSSREQCATIGAIWYEINRRELWRDFGYKGFMECVEQEGPRAYSTIAECMRLYEYFVINSAMIFDDFKKLVEDNGIRKVSAIRQQSRISLVPNKEEPPKVISMEKKKEAIAAATEKITPLSVRDAQDTIKLSATEKGIEIEQSIVHRIHLSPDQEEIFALVIGHIKSRERGSVPISDSYALILALQEYLGYVIPRAKNVA